MPDQRYRPKPVDAPGWAVQWDGEDATLDRIRQSGHVRDVQTRPGLSILVKGQQEFAGGVPTYRLWEDDWLVFRDDGWLARYEDDQFRRRYEEDHGRVTARTTPQPPDGPFYRCQYGLHCDTFERLEASADGANALHRPRDLRWIGGQWQCRPCYGETLAPLDPEKAEDNWDRALTLTQVLADDPGRWRDRAAELLRILRSDDMRVPSDYWNDIRVIAEELGQ